MQQPIKLLKPLAEREVIFAEVECNATEEDGVVLEVTAIAIAIAAAVSLIFPARFHFHLKLQ